MSHLSRDERLLALDGALDAARQRHLAECTACRSEVEALRGVLARVRAVDVPEPSPLFWDHLAARVGDAIAREPVPPAAINPWWSPRLAWAALAIVVTAAGAGYLSRAVAPAPAPAVVAHSTPPVAPVAPEETETRTDLMPDVAADDGWALLAALAEDAVADETFAPAAGQVESSISLLSADERRALAVELAAALAPARTREG